MRHESDIAVSGNDHLIAHHFRAAPDRRRGRSVIVGPATAVAQTYYFKFCTYLAEQGFDVLTFDYRGVAQSKLRPIRDYRDIGFSAWAEHDYPAVIEHMHALHPGQPLYIVGHSVGGWMPGATRASHRIDGLLGVAALVGLLAVDGAPAPLWALADLEYRWCRSPRHCSAIGPAGPA